MADGQESGVISGELGARLLMIEPEDFRRLERKGFFVPVSKNQFRLVEVVQGHIRFLQKERATTGRTSSEAAAHIDLGQRRFFELLDDGAITRAESYDLDAVRVQYIRHLRKVAAGRGSNPDIDLGTERALLTREQAEAVAMRNRIARGELVVIEEVGRQVEAEYAVVRQRFLAIPAPLADLLEGMNREEREAAIAKEITEALNELHNPGDGAGDGEREAAAGRPPGTEGQAAPVPASAEAAAAPVAD
jgi:phage terminase Nu1 subunit (DNA packaging protein)